MRSIRVKLAIDDERLLDGTGDNYSRLALATAQQRNVRTDGMMDRNH